jgi:fructokinase
MIVCCGEALIDMVPDGQRPDAFLPRPGGCPYNTAIAAARLGSPTRFIGRIGSDFLGELLVDRLRENGVDSSLVARSEQSATLAFVQRSSSGDARYAFYNNGAADRSLEISDLPDGLGGEGRPPFLAVGSISLLEEPLATSVEALVEREKGRAIVSIDPNIRPSFVQDRAAYIARLLRLVASSAMVKASSEDLEWLFPELAAEERYKPLLDAGAELVVETRGSAGTAARSAKLEVRESAFTVQVADTIGAGDTFHAAFLHCLEKRGISGRSALAGLDESSLREMLRFSQAAAALDCQKVGAEPPSLAEVERFLAARR